MDFQDEKNLPSELMFNEAPVEKLDILIDRSCLEIFINDGKYTIAYRYFLEKHDTIETTAKQLLQLN